MVSQQLCVWVWCEQQGLVPRGNPPLRLGGSLKPELVGAVTGGHVGSLIPGGSAQLLLRSCTWAPGAGDAFAGRSLGDYEICRPQGPALFLAVQQGTQAWGPRAAASLVLHSAEQRV